MKQIRVACLVLIENNFSKKLKSSNDCLHYFENAFQGFHFLQIFMRNHLNDKPSHMIKHRKNGGKTALNIVIDV